MVMAAFITLLAIGVGYADGSWNYAIARRQYFQFGVVSLITAGSFAVVYLAAYFKPGFGHCSVHSPWNTGYIRATRSAARRTNAITVQAA